MELCVFSNINKTVTYSEDVIKFQLVFAIQSMELTNKAIVSTTILRNHLQSVRTKTLFLQIQNFIVIVIRYSNTNKVNHCKPQTKQ